MRSSSRPAYIPGFTLIELLVVLVILGMLAGIVTPLFLGRADKARADKARADISTIAAALSLYRLDNRVLPTTEQGLMALVRKPSLAPVPGNWKQGGYLDSLPLDPWERPYGYIYPAEFSDGEYDLYTLGADGRRGGEDVDADIYKP
jgi:general secretion pathway protein G